jgi:hypothetical protein
VQQDPRYPQVNVDLKELRPVVEAIARERGQSRSEALRALLAESPSVIAKQAEAGVQV